VTASVIFGAGIVVGSTGVAVGGVVGGSFSVVVMGAVVASSFVV